MVKALLIQSVLNEQVAEIIHHHFNVGTQQPHYAELQKFGIHILFKQALDVVLKLAIPISMLALMSLIVKGLTAINISIN